MTFKEYTILTEEEYIVASLNGEPIEVFSTLECLQDVYGNYVEWLEVEYIDDRYDLIKEN